jgi:hypothetical protein
MILIIISLASASVESNPGVIGGYFSLFSSDLFILGFLTIFLGAVTWTFLIMNLAEKEIKQGLWIYLFISLSIPLYIALSGRANGQLIVFGLIIDLIGSTILIYCYWHTLKRIERKEVERIKPSPRLR